MGDIIKMADRDLYKEKRVKKSKEKQNSEKLKHLLREIEKLRDELNKKVTQEGKGINNEETLKLSQKLDELITRYLIDE
jgi:diguanylate cyclase